ncbi:MAG: 7-cyano-7-deazaguanine synthase QueC [Gammaproteobacteria bacterium]|uniref:7-cyano-7-deazaguanine synthase QueC n=1 Tax=Limnobacter sp. TaxID=2003368 RepID=UPI001D350FCD|nr:7-cyano-7-deazaguanine synthase QueC [Limnobacter sp.]MBU0783493.1 7-cyano-7-deazaguanine synthase QueC [Gammaproteobacteria bacterium]MBU0850713.1 7-cyano-7-deazaguanine synthase QueC [Gammaproteobacteria bacterium]MBU1267522.1 7-cyano-7-deazaguanine synthase QueC [Gammaproteobacteria bacterium]MBU1527598.1 7-cyano-7-deazaguanine synthase QueC [Gammaproteobacteria bacterium]MBU1780725.1 7-cyano-7-deazaguanine synthase QueC [Gammaproteobacteria bacterium]
MNRKALVLFSGGQDSTVCLAWALSKFDHVETIGFDYGQRHRIELECRLTVLDRLREQFPEWAAKLGEDRVIDLSWLGQISDCALTEEREIELNETGLPNTFVPGRNLVFFLISSAVAYRRGLATLVGGMCQTDFSGYPDCREDTLKALQVATNLGMASAFRFETPLMWIDKTETFQLGEQLGGKKLLEIIVRDTHTCYTGDRTHKHDWGLGCGECPACDLRKRGWKNYISQQNQ